jgi:hypothetical protein
MESKRKVFVIMPFAPEFQDLYRYAVKASCESLGVECVRMDEQIFTEGIVDRMFKQIDAADLVIGEMSLHNPNVYYEVGYATGRRKKVLLLSKSTDSIPFDLRGFPHIVYGDRIEHLEAALKKSVRELLDSTSDLGPLEIGGIWTGIVLDQHPGARFPESELSMHFRWSGRVEGLGTIRAGDAVIRLRFVGDFEHDRYLMLTYRGASAAMMQFGAALLRLDGTGNELDGRYLGYGALNDTIVYGQVRLSRRRSDETA